MSRRPQQQPPPPPQYFPQPFANSGVENNPRSANRSAPQPTAGNPPVHAQAVYYPQVPNDGTYLPQQPASHTSLQSSAPPPVRRSTRPPAPAPASVPTHTYSPSPLHSSGTVPQPPSFPIPAVPGGYGGLSNPSGLPPPPLPMVERTRTTYAQVGYQNGAVLGIPHQQSTTTLGWNHQDGGSGSYGDQDFGSRPDMTENMDDYARERGPRSLPFAGIGRNQHRNRAEEQVPQPDLPCIRCQCPTPPDEYARLGGYCSEKHRWDSNSSQNQNQPRPKP